VYEVSAKTWMDPLEPDDLNLSADGRVMEILSEQVCEGWLEGYLLTGRHGWLSCYEAFIHIVDSMVNQHAKWLKTAAEVPWRKPVASLNLLLTSHVWRQDHNGFSHQDPGFIDMLANKKPDVARIYLPPDANCLLSVADHCLRSRNYINVIVAGKQPEWQWLSIDAAQQHCQAGGGRWAWASHDDQDPDVVMACAGDVPTLETLAALTLLRDYVPDLRVRVVNIVDLMLLQPSSQHPHGWSDSAFNALFTVDRPVIFAFHGYPALIHRLVYKRANHANFHVRGFKEEGATTTPFDMAVINDLDRYRLALDVIERVPRLQDLVNVARERYWAVMEQHKLYLIEHGEDLPEVRNWQWTPARRHERLFVLPVFLHFQKQKRRGPGYEDKAGQGLKPGQVLEVADRRNIAETDGRVRREGEVHAIHQRAVEVAGQLSPFARAGHQEINHGERPDLDGMGQQTAQHPDNDSEPAPDFQARHPVIQAQQTLIVDHYRDDHDQAVDQVTASIGLAPGRRACHASNRWSSTRPTPGTDQAARSAIWRSRHR
jgi:hypothetical protein